MTKTIMLANPRGFCAGVDRAIAIVERALERYGAPIYVRHEVVHNRFVVEQLAQKGAVFIEDLDDVPVGATLIYSAHGVPQSVRQQAEARGLTVYDATCPLVTKVHIEVKRMHRAGMDIVMIGHAGHPEVEGTMGQVADHMYLIESVEDVARLEVEHPEALAYVSQTTLSVDETREIITALTAKFPAVASPKKDDICYATQNRQDAVKTLAAACDLVIVVGSPNSSNSNRLREVAALKGVEAYMVDNADQLQTAWFADKQSIGVTAGASAPEVLVQAVIARVRALGIAEISELPGVEEHTTFALPPGLR
jgi:4-hydroxy-3-methylbut-2-enyl diphosphate reductase